MKRTHGAAEHVVYPIRINRYLFLMGYCSRREADRLITVGLVRVNGKAAVIGEQVRAGDTVELTKGGIERTDARRYVAFYKPRGIVCHNPNKSIGEKGIEDIFPSSPPVYPVGRLDKDSEGLLLLTNDGRIVDRLLNPRSKHEKEYVVWIDKPVRESMLNRMRKGVRIEGYMTKPAQAEQTDERQFHLVLTEGKKHQIRRMCAALGATVIRLKRVRVGNIRLGRVRAGEGRDLSPQERNELLSVLEF